MEKKIVVPEGMMKAAIFAWRLHPIRGYPPEDAVCKAVEAALRWLSEHPIVPTQKQSRKLYADVPQGLLVDEVPSWYAVEWQRRMFLAPESEMIGQEPLEQFCSRFRTIGEAVLEAYRRGKEAK